MPTLPTMDRTEVPVGDDVQREATPGNGFADVTVGIPTRNRSRLLRRAIESVLAQRYRNLALIVSDNASEDDTPDVVASLRDPRVVYRPLETNIGRAANFNRLIELAETEFVVLLGDDDQLHPDHLLLTVDALRRRPAVGVIHTGYSIVDELDNTLSLHALPKVRKNSVAIESGAEFLERSMKAGTDTCFSSAVFRKAALVGAGGLHKEDGVIDDFPLFMRIATRWDFAYLNTPLAVMRAHVGASSSSLGSFTPRGFRTTRAVPDSLYERRLRFLAQADLPETEGRRLARMAKRTYRRDVLSHLSMRATTGDGWVVTFGALHSEIQRDRRLALDPMTWRFVVGQLGGRRIRDELRRALKSAQRHR
jgi:glycosyltransferase involved in cell wall biosynthesis